MSAALLRAVQTAPGQVLAVWRAMPGAYLLLGRASGPLPKSGSARLARHAGVPGIFRTFFWSLGTEAASGYLTVIRLPDRLAISDESEVILRGVRGADRDFALRLAPLCGEEDFGRHLASLADGSAAPLARFVLDLIRPEAEADVRRPILLLETFLHHAARHEGCVELLLEIPDRVLLLQGWGPPTGHEVELVLTGAGLTRHTAQVGEFARNDIQPPLIGSVLALPVEAARDLSMAQSIYLLTANEILCRRILDNRVLDPVSSIGQVRHLLPRLVCQPALADTLQHALQPQFDGVDTLNNSERRVRAALDIAVTAEGAGVFLSGWLFDPIGQVAKVEYCQADTSTRIDPNIVRIERNDVVMAFKNDSSFPQVPRSDIGFAVSASLTGTIVERPYLRFTFTDEDVAFLPLVLRNTSEPGVRAQLHASVDMHKSSALEIIERHLAPFATKSTPPALTGARVLLRGPLDRPHAVVVPLVSLTLPRSIIAGLLHDPLAIDEQIIFVCGPVWSQARITTLTELLQFYDLPATLIATLDNVAPLDAVFAASERCEAETFLLVSSTATISNNQNRSALRQAANLADAVCPTALYEDGSIRFAGMNELDFTVRPPFARLRSQWLGLSAEHLSTRGPVDAVGGTIECCLMTRNAIGAVERARRFSTRFGQEAAFFAELKHRGLRVVWQAAVVIATADEADSEGAGSAAALIDNWALQASWGNLTCAS